MALEIKIGGTTYRGTTDYSIKQQGGAVSTTSLNVLLGANPVPLVLQVAQVYLDGTLFFSGLIQAVSTPEYSSTYETKVFSIDVSSLECLMNHRLVTKNFYYYTYTSWTQVIQYLFDNYISQEGITLGSISTTSATFDSKYAVSDKKLYDVLNDIAEAIGNASWWISADRKFYFKISTDFTEVVPPTHLTKLKLSEKIGDIRTVEKMTGASSGITATQTNDTLLATIAARTGGSGKIEIAETDSDIHSDSKAATTANKKLLEYAESEKTITCVCHDLSKSEIYNSWPLNLTINGVAITGYYVVTDRTIEDHGPDAFSISVTLKNNNYFSRYGYSLKKVSTATNKVSSSILDTCADNKLTASEKPTELSNWNIIAAEKAGYDSEADSHSVSRVAYDAAFQALATYLNGGTAWASGIPLWFAGEHITETTDIDGGDYDDAWQAYYLARTGLEESIRSAIQSDASAAASAAAAAATLANSASKSWTQSSAPTIGTRPNAINGDTWYNDGSKYEAIAGVWRLQTSDVPLDPAAYYSMDEVPEIPDDPAGVTYLQDAWATTDGWIAARSSLNVVSIPGVIRVTATGAPWAGGMYKTITNSYNKYICILLRASKPGSIRVLNTAGTENYASLSVTTEWNIYSFVKTSPSLDNTVDIEFYGASAGDWFDCGTIYIGTGAYLPGSVLDNSGHGNHGQAFAVTPTAGISGNGLAFNGTNSYIKVPHTPIPVSSTMFAIRLPFRWDGAGGGADGRKSLIEAYQDSTYFAFYAFISATGFLQMGILSTAGVSSFILSTSAITANIQYNAVFVFRQNGKFSIYLNGALFYEAIPATNWASGDQLHAYVGYNIGTYRGADNRWFSGIIDEPAFYTRELSTREVLGLYQSKSLPKVYTRAQYLSDQAISDGVISPTEKKTIYTLWYSVNGNGASTGSYWVGRNRAIALALTGSSEYTALSTSYTNLYNYLYTTPGVLATVSWQSSITIVSATYQALWSSYYAAETAMVNKISNQEGVNAISTSGGNVHTLAPKYLGIGILQASGTAAFPGANVNSAGTITTTSTVTPNTGDWMTNYVSTYLALGIYMWSGTAWSITSTLDTKYISVAGYDLLNLKQGGIDVGGVEIITAAIINYLATSKQVSTALCSDGTTRRMEIDWDNASQKMRSYAQDKVLEQELGKFTSFYGNGAKRYGVRHSGGAIDFLNAPDSGTENIVASIKRISRESGFALLNGDIRSVLKITPKVTRGYISANSRNWDSIAWSPDLSLFCAISTSTVCGISSDGLSWTEHTISATSRGWESIVWSPELGLFCIFAYNSNICATSPDGINWTEHTISGIARGWMDLEWSPELKIFCAVSETNICATSSDGISWVEHSISGRVWTGIVWSPELGLFCAIVRGYKICATSPDGINWTEHTMTSTLGGGFEAITWSPELALFCATGASNYCSISPDGINWTEHTISTTSNWLGIAWSPELGVFCAVANNSNICATSPDGINWTEHIITPDTNNYWMSVIWSAQLGIFCAVANATTYCSTFSIGSYAPVGAGICEIGQNPNGIYFKIKTGTGRGILACFGITEHPASTLSKVQYFPAQFSTTEGLICLCTPQNVSANAEAFVFIGAPDGLTTSYFVQLLRGSAWTEQTNICRWFALGFYTE